MKSAACRETLKPTGKVTMWTSGSVCCIHGNWIYEEDSSWSTVLVDA